jgi:ubiquinone/menaquinone biosynthesis C-methylase UbiE
MGERLFKPQDAYKLEDPKRQIWLPVADVIRASAIRSGMHVADVGVGTGYFAIPLAQFVGPHGKIYAIDLQPEMLKVLHQKLEQPDSPRNIELVRGEASKTTLGSKCADVVLIANVWHELDDHEGALQEAARILLPGGTLALLDWRPDRNSPPGPPSDHRLSASDVVKFLTKHNWTTAPPVNLGHYSYFISARPPDLVEPISGHNRGENTLTLATSGSSIDGEAGVGRAGRRGG